MNTNPNTGQSEPHTHLYQLLGDEAWCDNQGWKNIKSQNPEPKKTVFLLFFLQSSPFRQPDVCIGHRTIFWNGCNTKRHIRHLLNIKSIALPLLNRIIFVQMSIVQPPSYDHMIIYPHPVRGSRHHHFCQSLRSSVHHYWPFILCLMIMTMIENGIDANLVKYQRSRFLWLGCLLVNLLVNLLVHGRFGISRCAPETTMVIVAREDHLSMMVVETWSQEVAKLLKDHLRVDCKDGVS